MNLRVYVNGKLKHDWQVGNGYVGDHYPEHDRRSRDIRTAYYEYSSQVKLYRGTRNRVKAVLYNGTSPLKNGDEPFRDFIVATFATDGERAYVQMTRTNRLMNC